MMFHLTEFTTYKTTHKPAANIKQNNNAKRNKTNKQEPTQNKTKTKHKQTIEQKDKTGNRYMSKTKQIKLKNNKYTPQKHKQNSKARQNKTGE